ncbi:acyltransferase [Microbacterium ulmi]|uniref:Acyltransferase n=1 Tax=Microbacterium ulmi TaxID=179095 RepID=A0A7Y2M3H8_9MICO|nr:acyltransferase [Microbacterium ulmi]NNH04413.1 acyltransferase [Microbacterium ulmi]
MDLIENGLRVRDALYTALARTGFASFGAGSRIMLPFRAGNPQKVVVGRDVLIGPSSWLMVPRLDADGPVIHLHDRVRMNQTSITAVQEVVIEEAVELARGVYISDHMHGFDDPELPIRDQALVRVAPVRIGRGAWLGQNVVVMPGVTIGAGAVVGANSVVTRDVPPRTVAVGAPARVIRELVP